MEKGIAIFKTIGLMLSVLLTLAVFDSAIAQTSGKARTDLKFLISYEPTAISPGAGTRGVDMSLCTNFYDTLIFENGADRTTFRPGIASEWKFNDKGDELVLKIRDDVTFHDGAKLTVDDVLFSLKYDLAQPPNGSAAATVKDYKVTGENQITIYLNYPYKPILGILATPNMSIINKAFYENCEKNGTNFKRVENGTGPYKLDKWSSGVQITMKANENWFGGKVAIKDVVYMVTQDSTTAALMIENGQADAYFSPAASDVKRLDQLPTVKNEWALSYSTYMVFFNTTKAPFDDPKLREAISYGIDRNAVIQGGLAGVGMVQPYPVSPGFFGYHENFKVNEYNLQTAKKKLADAGYPEGKLKVVMRTSSDIWYSLPAQVVQAQFEAMGIKCELEIMENGAFQSQVLTNHDYQVGYYNSYAFVNDADAQLWQYYHSTGDRNFAGIKNKDVDDLLMKARQSMNDDERKACYLKIAEINRDNNWYIYTLTGYNNMVHNNKIKGVFGNNAGIYKLSYWSW